MTATRYSSTRRGLTLGLALVLATTSLACSSDDTDTVSSPDNGSSTEATYVPGTRSTATNRPANPVIGKLVYDTVGATTSVVATITTTAGSDEDEVTATVAVYPDLTSRQRPPAPVYTASATVATGENQEVSLPLSAEALALLSTVEPNVADQLVVVGVQHVVDGDGDGNPEGSLHTRTSYHDAQVRTAGETVSLTIATDVAGVNVVTNPVMCMYQDSGSDFGPLTTTLVDAGDYVSSSIEADGSVFDSPEYGGPPWNDIIAKITEDSAVDTVRLLLDALSPVNVALQAVAEIISLGIDDCDSQASVFQVLAAAPTAPEAPSTSQSYVASEQTSNGLLSTTTALAWQTNMQEQGDTVWQETVSNNILTQLSGANADNGLSIAATNQSVGTLTTSSSWTFTIQQGGTSSIPNGCDDRGC